MAPNMGLKEQGVDPPNIEPLPKYQNSQGNKNGGKIKVKVQMLGWRIILNCSGLGSRLLECDPPGKTFNSA